MCTIIYWINIKLHILLRYVSSLFKTLFRRAWLQFFNAFSNIVAASTFQAIFNLKQATWLLAYPKKKNVSIAQNIHNSHQITWYIVERLLYLHRQHFQRKIRSKIRIQKLFFNLSTPCQTFTPLQADFCLGNVVLVFALRHSVIQKFVQFMLQSSLAQFRQR